MSNITDNDLAVAISVAKWVKATGCSASAWSLGNDKALYVVATTAAGPRAYEIDAALKLAKGDASAEPVTGRLDVAAHYFLRSGDILIGASGPELTADQVAALECARTFVGMA